MEYIAFFFKQFVDAALIVQILCVSTATVLCLGVSVNGKNKPYVLIIDGVCLAIAFLAFDILFCAITEVARWFTGLGSFLMYFAGIVIYAAVRSKHTVPNRIAMASVVFSISTLMNMLGTMIGNVIAMNIDGFEIGIAKIISYLFIIAGAVLFYNFPLYKYEENKIETVLNVVCNILTACLLIVYDIIFIHIPALTQVLREDFMPYMVFLTLSLFIIDISTYIITYFVCKQRREAQELRAEAQKRKTLDELVALSEHNLAELREIRHDVKNQYSYMQAMLEGGKYDELKKYFAELLGTFTKPLYQYIDSGNKTVDSILNMELNKAAASGIKLNAKVVVPDTLPFSKARLLGLCSNIIDNAIDAVLREKIEGAEIDVEMGVKGDYLIFCVTNPTRKKSVDGDNPPKTEKEDKTTHGYGIRIINKIVKRYNGKYHYCISEGRFIAECFLDLKHEEYSLKRSA